MNKDRHNIKWLTDVIGMGAVLIALIAFFGVECDNFLTPTNFLAIANQIPAAILIAVGMTLVLITGGIDLSVGSVVGLSGALLGLCLDKFGLPLVISIPACLAVGSLCGLINGLVIVRWSLPPFIVTLGMLEAARGATFLLTESRTIYLGNKIGGMSSMGVGNLSSLFIMAVVAVAFGQLLLNKSAFGRHIVALGSNEQTAYLSGINTGKAKVAVYALSGLLCALAAVVITARMASANPNAGSGFELEAIAAVVIGGTSLMGGRGSVVNSFFGVVIIALLGSGLAQMGTEEATKRMITGVVIVLAVILDYYRTRIVARRSDAGM
ncbi:MAG: ABC transporter permease [Armatimonadetes bacterium]|nr:ABC transporter permease [Armatimonadota bacterium]